MLRTAKPTRSAHATLAVGLGALLLAAAGCQGEPEMTADLDAAANMRAALNATGGGDGGEEATLAEPTGFVDFVGSFKVQGSVAQPGTLTVTSDQEVCAPGGKSPPDESIVMGPDNGLANVVLYLNSAIPVDDPKWVHESYAADADALLEGRAAGFDQEKCIFLSHVKTMRSSQTLQILNSDPVSHNTNISGEGKAKGSNSVISPGQTATYSPGGESRQPFRVSCNIHPWMLAYMIVRDSPYMAVSEPSGVFQMAKVPSGVELEFRVWHEKAGFISDATVSINGGAAESQKWSKGRFKITLPEGQDVYSMDVTIDAAALQ